jgi:hypothetical protein
MSLNQPARGIHAGVTPLPRDSKLVKLPEGPHDFHIGVEFPIRMNVGAVDSIRVELAPVQPIDPALDLGRTKLSEPLPVRLIVPGSLVVPAEQGLEPSPFRTTEATFHIVPLVPGPLAGARVEVLRDGRVEVFEMNICSQGSLVPRLMFWLTLLVPLLLFLPSRFPDWVAKNGCEHELLDWLPGIPGRADLAHQMQHSIAVLGLVGRDMHLSFFALAALLIIGFALWFWRRPRRATSVSEVFSIGGRKPSRPPTPPSYLTPVSASDIP